MSEPTDFQPTEAELTPEQEEILRQASEEYEGSWLCKRADCRLPVEANPRLYLSLSDDGTWSIDGVGDECAEIVCQDGHANGTNVLYKSLSAFLDGLFPGGTWEGSKPDVDEVLDDLKDMGIEPNENDEE